VVRWIVRQGGQIGLGELDPRIDLVGTQTDHIAALTASNAHVSNLSRNIHALTRFLTPANVEQARVYRDMLGTLDGDVRRHLMLTAGALAELGKAGGDQRGHASPGGSSTYSSEIEPLPSAALEKATTALRLRSFVSKRFTLLANKQRSGVAQAWPAAPCQALAAGQQLLARGHKVRHGLRMQGMAPLVYPALASGPDLRHGTAAAAGKHVAGQHQLG